MLQETLSYRMRFPIASVGNLHNQNTPQKVQWSQHGLPSHNTHLKPLQSLSLLPRGTKKKLGRAMPRYRELCKGCEGASLGDQLACVLQGQQRSGDGREKLRAQENVLLPKEGIGTLPHTPASPKTCPCPQDSYISLHLSQRCPTKTHKGKDRYRERASRKQNG